MLYGLLSELQSQHSGFDSPFAAIRDELMFRRSQGGGSYDPHADNIV